MDAFDYFLLVFVISDVAKDFDTTKTSVAVATTLTLAARPVGAAIFGYWADRVGRRTPLLVCVLTSARCRSASAGGGRSSCAPPWPSPSRRCSRTRRPSASSRGGFLMQLFVQGAWGVIPAHLTELSPTRSAASTPA